MTTHQRRTAVEHVALFIAVVHHKRDELFADDVHSPQNHVDLLRLGVVAPQERLDAADTFCRRESEAQRSRALDTQGARKKQERNNERK